MRYAALASVPHPLALRRRCALLRGSRSGFYAWRRRAPSARAQVNGQIVVEIRRIHVEVDRTYGSPGMQPELQARGLACGRHRVARLMRAHGIRAKQTARWRVTTDSRHSFALAPNRLGRAFTAAAPNRVWMGDVTYIPTGAGWCYLAVLMERVLAARRRVGDRHPADRRPAAAGA